MASEASGALAWKAPVLGSKKFANLPDLPCKALPPMKWVSSRNMMFSRSGIAGALQAWSLRRYHGGKINPCRECQHAIE